MKKLHILARASLLVTSFAVCSFAGDGLIVRVDPSVVNAVAKQHGLRVEKRLSGDGLYVLGTRQGANASSVLEELKADPLVQKVEKNQTVKLPELSPGFDKSRRKMPHLKGGAPSIPMAGAPWSPYVNQEAIDLLRVQDAQKHFGYGNSSIVVAIIDTAIDPEHPVLRGVIDKKNAKSFITSGDGSGGGVNQETTPFVDQETTPFVDGENAFVDGAGLLVLNQETTPFVDQETTPFVDQETTPFVDKVGPAYGHATMVAGIIHLVAPNVTILPIRAFKADGSGSIADVVAAIRYAVQQGAKIINMSFSASEASEELKQAIGEATSAGVICVASVANDGVGTVVYPSNFEKVIGVAATDDKVRAGFSNYGKDVDIAAQGVGVLSTYPGNLYAAGYGTSFSAPFVTGTVALMRSVDATENVEDAGYDLTEAAAKLKSPELDAGLLDVFKSVLKASKEK